MPIMDIFQELNNKFDLTKQIYNLSSLLGQAKFQFDFDAHSCTFEEYFGAYLLPLWKYNLGRNSLNEIKKEIGVYYTGYDYSMSVYNDKIFIPKNEDEAVKYLQYALNVVKYAGEQHIFQNEAFINMIVQRVEYILNKINHQWIKHDKEDYYIIVPCNDKTQRCAQLQTDKEVVFLLFEYTSNGLKGDISRKRDILKLLANTYEPIINELKSIDKGNIIAEIANKLSSCFNNFNIRHNNSDPKIAKNYKEGLKAFQNKDYEELYDAVYDLILDVTLLKEYKEHTSDIYDKYMSKLNGK